MEKIGDRALSDFVSTREAAERSGLSDSQICRLLRRRTVEGVKFGYTWAVYWPSLDAYLASDPKPGPKPRMKARQGA